MKKIVLTCEHGGAEIPAPFKSLFKNHQALLKTHRGLDIGALAVAFELKKKLGARLNYSVVSRLLIDLNRFLTSDTLFSEITRPLSQKQKNKIISTYYTPHWKKVQNLCDCLVSQNHQVFHIAVHSMTDNLNGKIRPMQLALLYNPKRPLEKEFAKIWIRELRKEFPDFVIARNNPYKGDAEGLTSHFRKKFKNKSYAGIELEMNQGFLKTLRTTKKRKIFSDQIGNALLRAVSKMN